MSVTVWRAVAPLASSTLPYSTAFSDTPRLTSFSSRTVRRAARRSSLELCSVIVWPSSSMVEPVPLKS